MRDLLPPASAARKRLARELVDFFALYGYERVTTPPFEHAEVLERGMSTIDRRDLLRFVEPDTGEVALLRPDITPQIARIVATRLRDRPPPWRLCYEGTIIRRRRGRARRQQQVAQAGVECVGRAGPAADLEVVELAARACSHVGLAGFRIELGHVRVGLDALAEVPDTAREDVGHALARKDPAALEVLLVAAGVPATKRRPILRLVELYGGPEVVRKARRLYRGDRARKALDELDALLDRIGEASLPGSLGVDLGELRGQAYYTGVSFTLLADGPGEPIGAGGRYDNLLARFDAPAPATGFALDLGHLEWALENAGTPFETGRPLRVVAAGGDQAWYREVADALRAEGIVCARHDGGKASALAFARAWEYDAVLFASRGGTRVVRTSDGETRKMPLDATWVRAVEAHVGPSRPGKG